MVEEKSKKPRVKKQPKEISIAEVIPTQTEVFLLVYPAKSLVVNIKDEEPITVPINGVHCVFPVFNNMKDLSDFAQANNLDSPKFFKMLLDE